VRKSPVTITTNMLAAERASVSDPDVVVGVVVPTVADVVTAALVAQPVSNMLPVTTLDPVKLLKPRRTRDFEVDEYCGQPSS
jgi:hypothetical protein